MVLDAVERLGVEPSFCAGHSLGEYTALTATGALGFDDGVRLVAERADGDARRRHRPARHDGRRARPRRRPGRDRLPPRRRRRVGRQLQRARPGRDRRLARRRRGRGGHAKELGAKKVMPLQVSGAFHTPFMAPARDRLRKAIADADPRDTEVPVVSNVDALAHDHGDEWASLLSAQLSSPVRWKHCLLDARRRRRHEFAELGPGGVLTGMAKRTVTDARTISVADAGGARQAARVGRPAGAHATRRRRLEGEHLFAVERLVVSPAAGVFTPLGSIDDGARIEVGTVLGHVGDIEVRSPFAGVLQSYIAVDTERVTARQPIAWLRSTLTR